MSEQSVNKPSRHMSIRHRGRLSQIGIYFARQLVMFVYQSDWKVLPMAALIAGLVGMVIRSRLFINMEGTLMGGFAMVMVCIWNGCFNSIQVICRERDVIKREHRSGMHISSYIVSHMLYQALLCLLQTAVTLYVTKAVGVKYPAEGLFTPWMIADFGISMFLITYASDMMSLWISSLARTTTTAMTIMPFVLIFQLVFSGGMLSLPDWTHYITPLTISNPALKVIAAQGDYNNRPAMTIWNQLNKMRGKEISATVTVGQVADFLQNEEIPVIQKLRDTQLTRVFRLGELKDTMQGEAFQAFRQEHVLEETSVADLLRSVRDADDFKAILDHEIRLDGPGISVGAMLDTLLSDGEVMDRLAEEKVIPTTTVGDVLDLLDAEGLLEKYKDVELGKDIYVRDLIDLVVSSETLNSFRDQSYTYSTTVGDLVNLIGEDRVKDLLQNKIADASYNPDYDNTRDNIMGYWLRLALFVLAFAALSMITLEFIDKDKR
ncbi:MAG: ABC transporter permease [Clostridia bacterium]|nr:ABC transporter permease [Clostridia bacterium]